MLDARCWWGREAFTDTWHLPSDAYLKFERGCSVARLMTIFSAGFSE